MADEQKKSPLEIDGAKWRAELLPKNKYNDKNTEPLDEAAANRDPIGIGENGTVLDQQTRQFCLKFNTYNEKNKYPNF
jgi:hypothetical protein